jgi:hypothetical protein
MPLASMAAKVSATAFDSGQTAGLHRAAVLAIRNRRSLSAGMHAASPRHRGGFGRCVQWPHTVQDRTVAPAVSPAAPPSNTLASSSWRERWQRFSAVSVHAFHVYAGWLVVMSWRRFIVYSLILVSAVVFVHDSPPFTWRSTEIVQHDRPKVVYVPRPAAPVAAPEPPAPKAPGSIGNVPIRIEGGKPGEGVEISIGKDGIKINAPRAASAAAPDSADAASPPSARGPLAELSAEVRAAVEEARCEYERAVEEAKREAANAVRDAENARRDAEKALEELTEATGPRTERRVVRWGVGDTMVQFAVLFVFASAILKYTYKGQQQAEVKAARATQTAEAESLKRQVVEARMAAMQAQIEPHFLFNTLASIDHLIETDPARASQMQKNLIALLRASMPTMREAGASGSGARELGREVAVIRPYLEILKVRMEERLTTEIAIPEGLHSAEFPQMMIQTLVENAIKHGLEPKAEGGHLRVAAEVVHGKLQVTVADTGLGFGKAATAGTGVGLANIRERLQMLYGPRAVLTVSENQPSGTVVTIVVPYKTVEEAAAAAA